MGATCSFTAPASNGIAETEPSKTKTEPEKLALDRAHAQIARNAANAAKIRVARKDSLEKRMLTPSPFLLFRMLHHTR
jgi:hypothetical protein